MEGPHPEDLWLGNVPFSWRHQKHVPKFLTIGSDRDCVLLRIGEKSGLRLLTALTPNNLFTYYPFGEREEGCSLRLFVLARSNEADSQVKRIEIDWNGKFTHDDAEMPNHLKIRLTPDDKSSTQENFGEQQQVGGLMASGR
jgi:hypothetical protein